MVARLKPGAEERARELAVLDPVGAPGIDRISTFVSADEVVFVLEGEAPDEGYRRFVDNPVDSTLLAPWLPLFDGPLHRVPRLSDWDTSTA